MKAEYLIQLVEQFCKENNFDISKVYKKLADVYLCEYGVNIDQQMRTNEKYDIVYYLEEIGIVERYVSILNGLIKMVNKGWDLELDKL